MFWLELSVIIIVADLYHPNPKPDFCSQRKASTKPARPSMKLKKPANKKKGGKRGAIRVGKEERRRINYCNFSFGSICILIYWLFWAYRGWLIVFGVLGLAVIIQVMADQFNSCCTIHGSEMAFSLAATVVAWRVAVYYFAHDCMKLTVATFLVP